MRLAAPLSLVVTVAAVQVQYLLFVSISSIPFSARLVQSCLIGGLTTIYGPKGWRAMPFGLEVVVTLV